MVTISTSSPREEKQSLRLGVVPYLNVAPIIYGLESNPRMRLIRDVPSRIAERLHAGAIDVGMIPSIEYAQSDYRIVPGIAIGSHGPVRSVNLYYKNSLEDVRRIALDASSRTSIALLRIVLQGRLTREPEYVTMPPPVHNMLSMADAALVIGDPALSFKAEIPWLDLGEEWTRLTGLPFVFAFWAGLPGALSIHDVRLFQDSLRLGLQSIPKIASSYNGHGNGQKADYASYLRSNMAYNFGEEEVCGLQEFYRRAHDLGLVLRVPELRFYGDP